MKDKGNFQQCYNAQTSVETGSLLIVGHHLTNAANDKEQLQPALAAVSPAAGPVKRVLIDSGFYSEEAVCAVENPPAGPTVYAAQKRQPHGRTISQLEKRPDPPAPPVGAGLSARMAHRLSTAEGALLYALRKQTVEPVFGIIKEAMGFRRFHLRGLQNVALEWTLVTLAYNLKRLFALRMPLPTA